MWITFKVYIPLWGGCDSGVSGWFNPLLPQPSCQSTLGQNTVPPVSTDASKCECMNFNVNKSEIERKHLYEHVLMNEWGL